jgi:hypothetical protein
VFGRTPTSALFSPALPSNVPIAPFSASRPWPVRSCRYMSKPPNWPSPFTVGRLITKICASRIGNSAPLACWMNSLAVILRSLHGLSLMKIMPTFSPWPMKLKPDTCIMPSKPSCFSTFARTCSNTSLVRRSVAPGGNCTMAKA